MRGHRSLKRGNPMARPGTIWTSTVGKKIVMAITGVLLLFFVIGHMLGNLKVYQGSEKFNAYAEFLREAGAPLLGHEQLLWIARIGLLLAVVLHIVAAAQLTRRARAARPDGYRNTPHLEFDYASRTMRVGGVILFLFVLYHLLHLTWGSVHPEFIPGDAYHNLVTGFRVWPASAVYIVAMITLGFHIYHGVWSGFQTLGLNQPRYNRFRRPLAAGIAGVIVAGNLSFPIAVLAGFVG